MKDLTDDQNKQVHDHVEAIYEDAWDLAVSLVDETDDEIEDWHDDVAERYDEIMALIKNTL